MLGSLSPQAAEGKKAQPDFEVWAIDQADTSPDDGGLLYIWDGADISDNPSEAEAEVIELAQAAAEAGCPVARRPHMLLTNHTEPPSHVIISNVGSGHIFFVDVESKEIVGCVGGAGNAHAAVATPDNSMVIVDDQNGQNLRKVHTDYASNSVDLQTHEVVRTQSLARPWSTDPKPDIADIVGDRMFIALRGPKPLTAIPTLESAARTPGVAVLKVHTNCNSFDWDPKDIAPMVSPHTTTLSDGTVVTSADPHGLEVVLR